jgi:hypothetical protein
VENLKTTFFEDPTYVYVGLVLIEIGLAAVWHGRRSGRLLAALAGPPVLAAAVFALSSLVVTQREEIIAAAKEIAEDLTSGGYAALERYLDEGFAGRFEAVDIDKAAAVEAARTNIRSYGVSQVLVKRTDVQVEGSYATMDVQTLIVWGDGRRTPIHWTLLWARLPEGWRIRELKGYRFGVGR